MEINTLFGIWYVVDVRGETHYVPPGLASLGIAPKAEATPKSVAFGVTSKGGSEDDADEAWEEMVGTIRDYVDVPSFNAKDVVSIEARECWGAQYHMPGYMDQTDWTLADTEEEAVEECKELYGDDEDDSEEE